ncbi:MAG: hypothetical protein GF320_19205 [Armatimonadia bacterium]|nr:hypothetical protein [Armatimonadia bacterium]
MRRLSPDEIQAVVWIVRGAAPSVCPEQTDQVELVERSLSAHGGRMAKPGASRLAEASFIDAELGLKIGIEFLTAFVILFLTELRKAAAKDGAETLYEWIKGKVSAIGDPQAAAEQIAAETPIRHDAVGCSADEAKRVARVITHIIVPDPVPLDRVRVKRGSSDR